MNPKQLGKQLRRIRLAFMSDWTDGWGKHRPLTAIEASKEAGLGENTVYQYERGTTNPTYITMNKILGVYGYKLELEIVKKD